MYKAQLVEQVLDYGDYMIYIELRTILGVSADSQQQHSVEHGSLIFLMSKKTRTILDTQRRALNGTGPRAYDFDESFVDRPAFVHRTVSCRTILGSGVQVSGWDGCSACGEAVGRFCVGFCLDFILYFFCQKAFQEIPFYSETVVLAKLVKRKRGNWNKEHVVRNTAQILYKSMRNKFK